MNYIQKKPVNRSKFRTVCGMSYYTVKRHLHWTFSGKKYTKSFEDEILPNLVFKHKTPLYRKLKDVDMYLQHNKVDNLKIAIKNINGIVIKPGESFSYWKLIGKTTYKRGYKDGLILCPDGGFKPGVGGGLCQLSNLIYWMLLHTELTVTERYRHSHDVFPDVKRTQPFGTGATCYYNFLDLEFKNNTNSTYQLKLHLTDEHLVGEFRSSKPSIYKYEVYEKEHSITAGHFGGYIRNNVIFRKVLNEIDEVIKDEYVAENHAFMMYSPYLSEASAKV